MAVSDPNGTVLAANTAYYRLYGYTAEEVLGHNFAIIFPREAREYAQELYMYMFRSPAISSPVESVARRADGSELFLESRYSFITREGERVAMISSIRDITERKRREEMLRDSQQVLQFLLEMTHSQSWKWDFASNSIRWSNTLKTSPGAPLNRSHLTYDEFLAQIHPEDRASVEEKIKQSIEQGLDYHHEFRTVWPDGSVWWAEIYGQVIYDENGKPIRMIGISPDITRRRRVE